VSYISAKLGVLRALQDDAKTVGDILFLNVAIALGGGGRDRLSHKGQAFSSI
jgi:hypothetical protein